MPRRDEFWMSGQAWMHKAETLFGKQSVNGIPEWVRSVGNPRLTFHRLGEEYIRIDGETQVKWYFAPGWITFFLRNWTQDESQLLRRRLSQPHHINPKGQNNSFTFRAYNEKDLQVLKDVILSRLNGVSAIPPIDENHADSRTESSVSKEMPDARSIDNSSASESVQGAVVEIEPRLEGREVLRIHRGYERDPRNRAQALAIHGTSCAVCGFNFDETYGAELARQFIEVHHVRPLSGGEGSVDPRTDLIPLCANCHRMIHRREGEVLTIDELRAIYQQSANK